MRVLFLVFILSFSFNVSFAQNPAAPVKLWDKTFGGNGLEGLSSILPTTDGGFILGGATWSSLSGNLSQGTNGFEDIWIIKTDSAGNKLWDKTIGGNRADNLGVIFQTSDGGYFIAGNSYSDVNIYKSFPNTGYWAIKLDANGNKVWDRSFGGPLLDRIGYAQQTTDGGYILAGSAKSGVSPTKTHPSRGEDDFWIVKLDKHGNKQWDKTMGGNDEDMLFSVQQTTDDGYILGGYSMSRVGGEKTEPNLGAQDYWLVKTDSLGNKLWDKTYGGNGADIIRVVRQTVDGGYIIGGYSSSDISATKSQGVKGQFTLDYWIIKTDAFGNIIWDKTIGSSDFDYLWALELTPDGGYLLGGFSGANLGFDKTENSKGAEDYWIVKTDAIGNVQWDKTFGGSGTDYFSTSSMVQTPDGGIMLGGGSESGVGGDKSQPHLGDYDFWILKVGPPCAGLGASLTSTCGNNGNSSVVLRVVGLPYNASRNQAWTVTYSVNGILQTHSDSTASYILTNNAVPGAVYSLVSIVSGACSASLNASLTVQQIPTAPTIIPGSSCNADTVLLTATGAPAGGKYNWYATATGGQLIHTHASGNFVVRNVTGATTFYVAAVNQSGCEGPRTPITATVYNLKVNAGEDETVCNNEPLKQLTGFSPAGGIWSGDGVTTAGEFLPVKQAGENYTLIYTVTRDGCIVSDTKQIFVKNCLPLFIPNIITQNQDGLNDTFQPQNLPTGKWVLKVYNRWGNKIYETEDYQNTWPETEIAAGTYYYLLQNPETHQQFKGWVEVVK